MARSFSVRFERDVPVPMPDGTVLYADLYLPDGGGPFPTLLQRTPYNKETPAGFGLRAAGRGYAVVVQDTRGRWTSGGDFHAMRDERADGVATCAWIGEQPWANGRIGMWGASYNGLTQWQAALGQAPGLEAIAPTVTAADYHEGWCYQGGAFALQFLLSWTLTYLATDTARRRLDADPGFAAAREALLDRVDAMDIQFDRMPLAGDPLLADLAPYYDEWLSHPAHGAFWEELRVDTRYGELDVAAMHVGGWYDVFLGGTLATYQGMRGGAKSERARAGQRLLIGPWEHMTFVTGAPVGQYDPGMRSGLGFIDIDGLHLRWYDRHLRDVDNGIDGEPPVAIFVMGQNRWRQEHAWPLERAVETPFYFGSGGRANGLDGDGTLSRDQPAPEGHRPDAYAYNPLDPVPTVGGGLCCNLVWAQAGAYDQRRVEARADVLCYTSPPLEADLEVTGPVRVVLYAASSAVDTDFTAKLVDVCPCGCARNLTDGIVRARYRTSGATEALLTPGQVEEYAIDLWATSNLFRAGHRIRVEIGSSNFPRFDRNPNTGGVIAAATRDDCRPALQTVFHDAEYPSRILLPVVSAPPEA